MCGAHSLSLALSQRVFPPSSSTSSTLLVLHLKLIINRQVQHKLNTLDIGIGTGIENGTEIEIGIGIASGSLPLPLSPSISLWMCCKWNLCAAMKHFYNNFWHN